jgi:exopolyphosphatase / guanosine-5'-triphosphate,3'-diphosphate pyrophosphatase
MNIASIDIGSNTVLLLIAEIDPHDNSLKPVLNEYRMPRIGKGLTSSNEIAPEKIQSLNEVIDEYLHIIRRNNCSVILAAGTNALRIASNSDLVTSSIRKRFGLDIKVITGNEEARFSYLGAISAANFDKNIVIDIGGGSTEIIYGSKDEILFSKSFPIGVVNLTERFCKHNPPTNNEIDSILEESQSVFEEINSHILTDFNIIAVAGTPTSVAGIKLKLDYYDEEKVNNSILTENELKYFIGYFSGHTYNELLSLHPAFLSGREDVILAGTIMLYKLITLLKKKELTVSTRGIRYGLILDYINKYSK